MTTRSALNAAAAIVERVLDRHRMVDRATIRGEEVKGYFRRTFVESGDGENAVAGHHYTFECAEASLPDGLEPDVEEIEIVGEGTFRYLRREEGAPGRVVLLLGTIL